MFRLKYARVLENCKDTTPHIWMYNDEQTLMRDLKDYYCPYGNADWVITSSDVRVARRTEYWNAQQEFEKRRNARGETFAINLGHVVS